MKEKCWNCGKENEKLADGYYHCDCKRIGGEDLCYSDIPGQKTL